VAIGVAAKRRRRLPRQRRFRRLGDVVENERQVIDERLVVEAGGDGKRAHLALPIGENLPAV
jgi:hypothetical protein